MEQPNSLLSILSRMGLKSSILGMLVSRGSPRYVKGKLPFWDPILVASVTIFSWGTFIGTITDFHSSYAVQLRQQSVEDGF